MSICPRAAWPTIFLVRIFLFLFLTRVNFQLFVAFCISLGNLFNFYPANYESCKFCLQGTENEKSVLDWSTRIKIAAGTARGLEYLHCVAKPPVIYRDLKSANILLDNEYNPRLSDFGLAKLGPVGDNTHVSTRVMGTYGYCAPEYALSGKLTLKSDIFSFGVVLLEIVTGRKAFDISKRHGEQSLAAWVRFLG